MGNRDNQTKKSSLTKSDGLYEIFEIENLSRVMEQFYRATGLANLIVDIEGNILHGVGWTRICTEFHKKHKISAERCLKSDANLANGLKEKEKYSIYICQNGMMCIANPVILDGVHVANLFIGQFFLETPDKNFFMNQAEELGLDKQKYMNALEECRVYNKEIIVRFLDFLSELINMIGQLGLKTIQQKKLVAEITNKDKQAAALISAKEQAEALNVIISEADKYNRSLFEANIALVITTDTNGIIKDVNTAAENATGIHREKLIGTYFAAYFTEPGKAEDVCLQVFKGCKVFDYELMIKHINGGTATVLCNVSAYKDDEGKTIGMFVAKDITAIRKYESELMHLKNNLERLVQQRAAELLIADKELAFESGEKADRAAELVIANEELAFESGEKVNRAAELIIANKELIFQNKEKDKRAEELIIANKELVLRNEEILYISHHDFLTGLYNRIYFEEAKKRFDTSTQLPISVIMGDVNGLKLINDGFGHSKGDGILVELAKILSSCCRQGDIISRIGGDEFGILLPKTDNQAAQQICSCIYEACKEYTLNGSVIYPSISLGYATKNIKTESIDGILIAAEEYMYRQKLVESKSAHSSIITSIKAIMFEQSQETEEHADRLIQLSKSIGLAMSLTDDQLNELELLSTLHDIGKMGIGAEILSKPGKLSDAEWVEMRKHPEIGFRIAQASSELIPIARYILHHHERWDGKGYPQGLIGEQIPLLSRIVGIVDAFDAMTNDRAYRTAISMEEAIEEIKRNSGTQFDPNIARLFIKLIS